MVAIGFLLAGGFLSGCGASAGATDASVTLSGKDDGRTITVKPGTTIQLTLEDSFGPPGSSLTWDADSSAPSVLVRSTTRMDPALPPNALPQGTVRYLAEFKAQAAGQAQIVGHGRRTCEAMNPAFCQQATFAVTVQVTA
jgi:predicted secreted protein